MNEPSEDDRDRDDVVTGLVEIVLSAVGAGVGYASGSPEAAVAGAALAPSAVLALQLDRKAWRRRLGRAAAALESCQRATGMSVEDLDERAESDPAAAELLARVLQAAADARLLEKLEALGRVLSQGLTDDTRLDEAFLLAAALDDLEAPHVRLLATINGTWDGAWAPAGMSKTANLAPYADVAGGPIAFPAVSATLVRHGLIDQVESAVAMNRRMQRLASMGGAGEPARRDSWTTTQLGHSCLTLLLPEPPASA